MKLSNFILICLLVMLFGCMNVVLKNTKNNTVQVAKLDQLFELGDTILFNNIKHEIIRKKLRNGNIVKKEPIVRPKQNQIPPPSKKP
jgi:hypothetical protein